MHDITKLCIGQEIERDRLIELLVSLHYARVEWVAKPGEFAIRGYLIDIYPITYRSPIRLEFRVNKIESIRDFSIHSGETFSVFEELLLIPVTPFMAKKLARAEDDFQGFEPLVQSRDLERGDYVVHMKYGIGRFLGTKMIQMKGERQRYLAIEYANKEILYLDPKEPMERYIGGAGKGPKLTKLHGKDWERIKEKTKHAVDFVAGQMLSLQALRSTDKGFSYPPDHEWQKDFEKEFPFQETPDQTKTILEIKRDMESDKPMDRLLAGDVGYGKTEVAIRAAFKAVMAGKQVAVLVPTTVLAEQHFVVFHRRMKSFPVSVECVSRFRTQMEQKNIVKKANQGQIDILIGTHRLLSSDVHFKELGLVIVDEEQRFGVRHKEKLKLLRTHVDVLTMTATPIPRTLYMSLVGVRDMSTIQTPPVNRLPVETHVGYFDDQKVRQAIHQELARQGQVIFIHNRVQSIEKIHQHLQKLLPDVRLGVGHGQMSPHDLEKVMDDFMDKKVDCLIATSIVESGIDIPNVNTIMINRADLFGLSDLYQLRGRVGRYHEKRQAYAYFFLPKNTVLSQNAEKRLAAMERFTELGAGFKLALEDLEIRGAGNLLGHEQSGFIHAVGFDLYCRMLKAAVEEQKRAKTKLMAKA